MKFLENVLSLNPTGKIVMILDNAHIHRAKLLQPFLDDNSHSLELISLPPYSPKLNLIEGLWGWLKSEVINNVFYKSLNQIRVAVRGFTRMINQDTAYTIKRLCLRM